MTLPASPHLPRRRLLQALGLIGASPLLTWLPATLLGTLVSRPALAASCTLAPQLTEGPYWVDEKLERSDLTTNTSRASVLQGTPLALTINVVNGASTTACVPLTGVQIDLWHCDAIGEYSDVSGNGQSSTVGQNFLRGFQKSDANGQVKFTTIYPGWYSGRATHIHVRARAYDSAGNTTFNFTTQIFFDDSLTDTVYASAPYNSRGTRDTRNSNDLVYRSGGSSNLLVPLTASGKGYAGEVTVGLTGISTATSSGGSTFTASASATGTAKSLSLSAQLNPASADIGSSASIYVAAQSGRSWYLNNGATWVGLGSSPAPYSTVTLATSHNLSILSNVDVSALGGTALYVGYGKSANEMLSAGRFQKVYTLT